MDYQESGSELYLRIAKGEPILATIQQVCQRVGILGGHFQGIGACDQATLATYLAAEKQFTEHQLTGMLELVSLSGNISQDTANHPYLHAHAIFSYRDDDGETVTTGGHLKEARVGYTAEIVITRAPFPILRQTDPAVGIDVWRLPN